MRCFLIITFIGLLGRCYAGDTNEWIEVRGLRVNCWCSPMAVLRGKIYIAGGPDGARTNLFVFDGTNWSQGPKPPGNVQWCGGAVLNNKIYISSPWDNHTNFWSFDETNWAWEPAAPNGGQQGIGQNNAAVFNGAYYQVGGHDGVTDERTNVYKFNGTSWAEVMGLPVKTRMSAVAVFRDRLYSVGGYNQKTNVYVYDGTNWTWGPAFPGGDNGGLATNNEDRLIFIQGNDSVGTWTNVYSFDGTNWTTARGTAHSRRALWSAVNFNGKVYAIGGYCTNVEYRLPDAASPITALYLYGVKISKLCGVTINKLCGRGQ